MVGLADMIDNQYVIRLAASLAPKVNVVKSPTPKIWHARLGHLSYGGMQKLASVALGMELKGPLPSEICGGCMVGRQQRQPSRELPNRRATEFLEFVHSDLGGPLPSTQLGQTFYISFYDNSTGCYYIEGMRHKSQAFEKFVKFVTWAQNQSGNKLKRYHIDFGGEFNNKFFKTCCEKNGVQWKPSAPYSLEQNGKAKRLNYTLMSLVCSIFLTMKLSKSLWLETLITVAYFKNRSPSIDGITPFEHFKGEKPNLRHLKIVGSCVWVHIPKEKRRKLDERSWQEIFVGYEGKNQYQIYNP